MNKKSPFYETTAAALEKTISEIFDMMLAIPVTMTAASEVDKVSYYDVNSFISLSNKIMAYNFSAHLPKITALSIASKLLMTPIEELGDDVNDACLEMMNMVAGNMKREFSEQDLTMSLPTIITGENISMQTGRDTKRLLLSFSFEDKSFEIEVFRYFKEVEG